MQNSAGHPALCLASSHHGAKLQFTARFWCEDISPYGEYCQTRSGIHTHTSSQKHPHGGLQSLGQHPLHDSLLYNVGDRTVASVLRAEGFMPSHRAKGHFSEDSGLHQFTVLSLWERKTHTGKYLYYTAKGVPPAHQLTSPEANMAREDCSRLIPRYSVLIALPKSCGNI